MRALTFPILTMLLIGVGTAAGQERERVVVKSDGQIVVTPEMEAEARRRLELLGRQENFTFRIVREVGEQPGGEGSRGKEGQGIRFKVGSEVSFELSMTSMLNEPVVIVLPDGYERYRPQLFKGGELLPYSGKAAEILEARKTLYSPTSLRSSTLKPDEVLPLGFLNLKHWYEPLKPGEYQLLLKYRPGGGENWLDFPRVTFEVVP